MSLQMWVTNVGSGPSANKMLEMHILTCRICHSYVCKEADRKRGMHLPKQLWHICICTAEILHHGMTMHHEWSSLSDYNEDTLECNNRITIRHTLLKAFTVCLSSFFRIDFELLQLILFMLQSRNILTSAHASCLSSTISQRPFTGKYIHIILLSPSLFFFHLFSSPCFSLLISLTDWLSTEQLHQFSLPSSSPSHLTSSSHCDCASQTEVGLFNTLSRLSFYSLLGTWWG